MGQELVSSLILPVCGFLLVSLLGIVGWFLIRTLSSVERNMDRHAHSIGELALSIKELGGVIKSIEGQMLARQAVMDNMLKEHHEADELARTRIHYTFGKACVLKNRFEILADKVNELCEILRVKGVKADFADQEWEMPNIILREG